MLIIACWPPHVKFWLPAGRYNFGPCQIKQKAQTNLSIGDFAFWLLCEAEVHNHHKAPKVVDSQNRTVWQHSPHSPHMSFASEESSFFLCRYF